MLSPETTAIIKATVPVLQQHGETITTHFYRIMFRDYPAVKAYFNQAHQAQGTQPRALANSVLAYAANIDRLEALGDALPVIIQKHVSLDIRPEHYPIVGTCLLQAIREVLGDAASDDIINAWAEAYGQLADILIAAEEAVYAEHESRTGGWRGPRRFRVVRKQPESAVITSFYFEPEDGGAIMDFEPGQYLTVLFEVNGEPVRRNYSLSCAPGEGYYRISVKREPEGVVSNHLHDRVEVGDVVELLPPCGEFVLTSAHRPLVLLTGGVGITPAMSMLKAAAPTGRPIEFVHAALNSSVHAFRAEVDELAARYPNVRPCYVYSEPLAGDEAHAEGFVSRDLLASRLPASGDADLYFVGPKPFMSMVHRFAGELELPRERVRYEFFGPAEALEAAAG
ncbi:MAG: NO-inducible flavohemoprotein [Porticoccaceae bacterium]|jgi:nitric oxide dioxygenase|nr:NO-inducible flavohemoprotein [Porticoccaceae bacterium]